MIKKYIIEQDSVFNKSIILSLFEKGECGFHIEGLSSSDIQDLFPSSIKIRFVKNEVDIKCLPSRCLFAYLDEEYHLKALLLLSHSNKYYLFKVDPQNKSKLTIHQKYISNDANLLTSDYEKHCKTKGKNLYDGEGDFSLIKDIDYFENSFKEDEKSHLSKESTIYRLTFANNNMFTADFIDRVEKKQIHILNSGRLDKTALTLDSMSKNINDRRDCLLIDSETKDIKYFIFTYKPYLVKHYFLFKNVGDDSFEFIKETTCFNEIFSLNELKDIKFKNSSEFATKSFAKYRYDNFFNEFVLFEEEEEFEEEVKTELPEQIVVDVKKIKKDLLLTEALQLIKQENLTLDIGITYHGRERIIERIGEMSDDEMLSLAKVAYEKGLTSAHYIEKDPVMFSFLSFKQSKIRGKILKIYNDILFFFSLEAPHELVTCFPYENNYEMFVSEHEKKKKKK